ncbi:MAG: SDR family NAD(P)-dependent oxidoreductase [Flavobacteriales bacterium]|nr:SDR family NAD(P)-dependent oxidoreductase [Flavobacteriales bacterium]
MKNVVITGVSSGIGLAITRVFAAAGFKIFGSVRKKEDALRLKEELGDAYEPLFFDLTDDDAIKAEATRVAELVGHQGIQLLVNNGGISGGDAIMHVSIDYMKHIYDVNTLGLLRVSQAFFPLLKISSANKSVQTKIVNISSGAGRAVRPYLGPYAATKHAVEAISDAMRRELMRYGIDVVIIEPGPIATEIWNKNKAKAGEYKYQDTDYATLFQKIDKGVENMEHNALPAEKVGRLVLKAYTKKKPDTRYLIAPSRWMFWLAIHIIPDRWLDNMFKKQFDAIEFSKN